MFRAKVSALFRNVINNTLQCDSTLIKIPANALYSNTAISTNIVQKPVPDKLYKKIEIEVRGNDPAVLKSYGVFAQMAAENLGITITRNTAPYKAVHERLTVLKSVHIYKKHRVQYEMRTYFRFIDLEKITGSTADTFLEYIQRNLPEGVAMKVTKVEIQKLPNHIRSPQS